jgi:hypothetical protein
VVLGAILTGVLSYRVVPWLVWHVDKKVKETLKDRKDEIIPPIPGGDIAGYLECAIFFASFAFVGIILAAAWLVFKTAAIWKTWDSMGVQSFTEVQAKYRTIVIGTGANIVAALVGAAVAYLP